MRDNKGQFGLFFRNKESYKLDTGLSQACFPRKIQRVAPFLWIPPLKVFPLVGGNFMKGK